MGLATCSRGRSCWRIKGAGLVFNLSVKGTTGIVTGLTKGFSALEILTSAAGFSSALTLICFKGRVSSFFSIISSREIVSSLGRIPNCFSNSSSSF